MYTRASIVVLFGFIISWYLPDSVETKYGLDRYHFIIERGSAAETLSVVDTVHAPAVRDSSAAGLTFFSIEDISVIDSIRYVYRLTTYVPSNPDTGKWTKTGDPSNEVSGLRFDWSQEVNTPRRRHEYEGDDLLVLYLASTGWLLSWDYFERMDIVEILYRFDFNADEILGISDFVVFASRYGTEYSLSDFREFADVYSLLTFFEFSSTILEPPLIPTGE